MSYFLVRPDVGRYQPWSAEIYLRSQVARDHAVTHTFSYLSMPLQATNWVPVICGWLQRAFSRPARLRRARSPVRTSPLASELPLTCEALPFAGGASAPYLPGCARQLFIVRCAHYARGASLSTFGFVTIVPRYLPKASNSLTFVRGADRACCAPRKRRHNLTYVPSKWPLGLLYCINGFADQPIPASASRRATPKGVERAPGRGTLPPLGSDTLPLNIPCSMRNVTRPGPFLFLKTNACQGDRVPPPAVPP